MRMTDIADLPGAMTVMSMTAAAMIVDSETMMTIMAGHRAPTRSTDARLERRTGEVL
jgi:hypothetical protein